MAFGAFVFWAFSRRYPDKESRGHKLWVDNHEPICAGIIAGAALMGVADAVVLAFFL